jgi:DoxX-like family
MTTLFTAYAAVTLLAVAANGFSGVATFVHFKPILAPMARVGVPESWLTFPIGSLKMAGAVGLLLGLIGVPLVGAAAAIGLILFFVCAMYTHVRAHDYSPQLAWQPGFCCWPWPHCGWFSPWLRQAFMTFARADGG